jgi:hypothetical protein
MIDPRDFRAKYQADGEAFLRDFKKSARATYAELKDYYEHKRNASPFDVLSAYMVMAILSELFYIRARRYFDQKQVSILDKQVRVELFEKAHRRAWKNALAKRREPRFRQV